ncbi:hypothetical protein SVIOM74S_05837 [Streptomyces violarus]
MGIDISEEAGWLRNKGLRIIGGGVRLQLDWPDLASFPDYGLVRKRDDFDEQLARQAQKAGARLFERCNVGAPILDERAGRITGVTAKLGEEKREVTFRAPLVVAADGNSTRLSLAMGLHRREDRPMGVAVRTYFTCPRHEDDYLESWLELWDRRGAGEDRLLPGYGWIFGMGDGTSNVGLGVLNTSDSFKELDWREVLKAWCASMPEDWGYTPDNMTGPIRGAALPMAFNRQPHYTKGLLLVGDAGGLVNPFNGEGIAYAMESGQIAADVIVQAHARATPRAAGSRPPALPARPEGHLRRLLHPRPRLREAHRQPEGHEDRGPARSHPPDADEVHPEAARQPHRPDGRRRDGPAFHQRADEGGAEGLITPAAALRSPRAGRSRSARARSRRERR